MQATVRSFDAPARSGTVFLDDGTVLTFGPEAFGASGLRLLRPGQRVRIRLGRDGAVAALTLSTFPLPRDGALAARKTGLRRLIRARHRFGATSECRR